MHIAVCDKTTPFKDRVLFSSTIYFTILLVIYTFVTKIVYFAQCLHVPDLNNKSSNAAKRYFLRKTAFLQAFPPIVDLRPDLNILSETFETTGPLTQRCTNRVDEEKYRMNQEDVDMITKKVRVVCSVLTFPENHYKKAIHVKNTWGKRCNKLIFISSADDPALPSLNLHKHPEKQRFLWSKTKEMFKYIYENLFYEADWFIKADDDTYVILEHLRYFLIDYNTNQPYYFGWPQTTKGETYMDGGAGYVLSRGALRLLVEDGLHGRSMCALRNDGFEDLEIGKCLWNLGIPPTDAKDSRNYRRFHSQMPREYIFLEQSDFYWNQHAAHLEGFSDTAISFHKVSPQNMYALDYMIYGIGYCCKWRTSSWEKQMNDRSAFGLKCRNECKSRIQYVSVVDIKLYQSSNLSKFTVDNDDYFS